VAGGIGNLGRVVRIYFDTNILRYFGNIFNDRELPAELRARIVLSPISVLELMSQLCDDSAARAFAAVQAMWNWLPQQVSILDIPPIFIKSNVAGAAEDDNVAFERLTNALSRSLHARSAQVLRESSKELRDYLQRAKLADAQGRATDVLKIREGLRRIRKETLNDAELRGLFVRSLALRAGVPLDDPRAGAFTEQVEAYYHHEIERLKRAIGNPKMNLVSKKRQNDLFDSQQLLYLSVPELHYLSTDRSYLGLLNLQQGARIHLLRPETFASFNDACNFLRDAMQLQ
jgi:hypothetical protein